MSAGNLLFAVAGAVALAGAIITVSARNPIRCAVGLLATILAIALLFLKLSAQFLAAIQVIVYAGAVVVLFVFVIMLLGPDVGTGKEGDNKVVRAIGGGLLALTAGAALFLLVSRSTPTVFGYPAPDHGSVEAVGSLLFSDGIVPFELATALLIVAVVGAVAVARGRPSKPSEGAKVMFQGPVVARDDRGRPRSREADPS